MFRCRRRFRCSIVLLCASLPGVAGGAEVEQQVDQFFKQYTAAFATGDAAALAGMWTADAEWSSAITGEHSTGRAAVQADFESFFQMNPGAQLAGEVQRAKQVAPGVVCIEGLANVTIPGEAPAPSAFTAVLVAQDGKWLLANVQEGVPPVPDAPFVKLQALDHLVGEWRDDGGEAEVRTTFQWAADGAFLVRSYSIEREDETTRGTQIIGWDPRENRMRSWNFVSDGSFGGGAWSRSGDEWIGRLSQTLPDGGSASATQVIRKIDDDTLEVETVGREVNGEPQPSSPPVRVVRVAAQPASESADAASPRASATVQGGQQ